MQLPVEQTETLGDRHSLSRFAWFCLDSGGIRGPPAYLVNVSFLSGIQRLLLSTQLWANYVSWTRGHRENNNNGYESKYALSARSSQTLFYLNGQI